MSIKLTFYGGVGSTTGANIMLECGKETILVDCGLRQGGRDAEEENFKPFEFDPKIPKILVITHGHMDHLGRVPKLVREGFVGKIISTTPTKELARPMLLDAMRVIKTRHKDRELFNEQDLEKSLSMWEGFEYGQKVDLFDGCTLEMIDAGHILGSAILIFSCETENGVKKIAFTGDLGNSPSPLLNDTEIPKNIDYLVMESVYGDRNHEHKEERREKLKQVLLQGIEKEGAIIIPTFSIERTQVLLYEINNMIEDGEIPKLPVFVDSPLAIKVTEIYKKHLDSFNKSLQKEIKEGDDIFNFPGLQMIKNPEDSKEIEKVKGSKIVLAGSGMSEGGRVVNHEMEYLGDPNATILFVGYQSVGSLGRKILDGAKEIEIWRDHKKEKIRVKAKIESIMGYSSHMDSEHLLEFVERSAATGDGEQSRTIKLKKVFVIMGEPKSSLFLTQRIRDYLDIEAIYPDKGKVYKLN